MGTIRDQKTGETIGTVRLFMNNIGEEYWLATLATGERRRFYFADVGVGSGAGATCEFEAVRWVMQALEVPVPKRALLSDLPAGKPVLRDCVGDLLGPYGLPLK